MVAKLRPSLMHRVGQLAREEIEPPKDARLKAGSVQSYAGTFKVSITRGSGVPTRPTEADTHPPHALIGKTAALTSAAGSPAR